MRATMPAFRQELMLLNQKGTDSGSFLFARMAALCPRVLLQQLVQGFNQAGDFFRAGVVDERSAQYAFVGVDSQCFNQAVGVEVPYSDAQFESIHACRQFGGALPVNSECDRGGTVYGPGFADQVHIRVSRKKIE